METAKLIFNVIVFIMIMIMVGYFIAWMAPAIAAIVGIGKGWVIAICWILLISVIINAD